MKKIAISLLVCTSLFSVTGCAEQTQKLEYIVEVTDAVPEITRAFTGMQTLYTNPLAYTHEEWVKEFRENKVIIEEEYNDLQNVTPLDSMASAHETMLSVLKATVDMNVAIDEQIKTGEEIDYKEYLDQWTGLTKSFEDVTATINNLKESISL